jgi:hypothetical protein
MRPQTRLLDPGRRTCRGRVPPGGAVASQTLSWRVPAGRTHVPLGSAHGGQPIARQADIDPAPSDRRRAGRTAVSRRRTDRMVIARTAPDLPVLDRMPVSMEGRGRRRRRGHPLGMPRGRVVSCGCIPGSDRDTCIVLHCAALGAFGVCLAWAHSTTVLMIPREERKKAVNTEESGKPSQGAYRRWCACSGEGCATHAACSVRRGRSRHTPNGTPGRRAAGVPASCPGNTRLLWTNGSRGCRRRCVPHTCSMHRAPPRCGRAGCTWRRGRSCREHPS